MYIYIVYTYMYIYIYIYIYFFFKVFEMQTSVRPAVLSAWKLNTVQ